MIKQQTITYSSVPNNRTCTLINIQDYSAKTETFFFKKYKEKSSFTKNFDSFYVLDSIQNFEQQ